VPRAVKLLHEVRRLATPEPVVLLVDGLVDTESRTIVLGACATSFGRSGTFGCSLPGLTTQEHYGLHQPTLLVRTP